MSFLLLAGWFLFCFPFVFDLALAACTREVQTEKMKCTVDGEWIASFQVCKQMKGSAISTKCAHGLMEGKKEG